MVVCQAKGSFSLKEPSLAPYRAMAQRMEEKFSTFEIEHAPSSTRIEVNKREESIIEVLKEKFQEKQGEGD